MLNLFVELPSNSVDNKRISCGAEGYLTSCTFDYMTDNMETKMFVFVLWIWCWIMPLGVIVFSYGKITTQVMTHEARLKEQAKKMNVESLRSGANKDARNEIRVAKVGISLTTLSCSRGRRTSPSPSSDVTEIALCSLRDCQ